MDRSRNDELLLSILRIDPEGRGALREEELSGADWDDLLLRATRHGVTPLLYHRLNTYHPDTRIPAEVFRKLRNSYLQSAGRNVHLYHDLGKVLGRLRQDDIPVIVLKGAHLAIAVYRNIALRPMLDVDLLVNKSDLKKVQEVLVDLGYTASKNEIFSAHEQLPQYRKKDSICLEIHYNIADPPFSCKVDVGKLFGRAQTCFIEGIEVLSLCPEDLFLHLCIHASYHHGFDNGITPLFDIATVMEHYKGDLDWEQVLGRSKEWGVGKCVYIALSLSERVAGAAIPEKTNDDWGVHQDGLDAIKLAEELLFGKGSPVAQNVAKLFDDSTLREKLRHIIRRTFPPIKIMADTNPGMTNPLSLLFLYIFRIKGLFARHGRTSWRLIVRDKEMSTFAASQNRRNILKDWLVKIETNEDEGVGKAR